MSPPGEPASGLAARTARNSLWNVAGFLLSTVLTFVVSPMVVRHLGLEHLGIYGLVTAVLAPLSLANLGFGEATVRYVAEHAAQRDWPQVTRVIGTTLFMNLMVGLVGTVLLVAAGPWLVATLFATRAEDQELVRVCMYLVAAGWLANQAGGVFAGVPAALQEYRRTAVGGVLLMLLNYALVVGAVQAGGGLVGYAAATVAGGAASSLYWFWLARNLLPNVSMRPRLDTDVWKTSFRFGGWQTVAQLAGLLAQQAERYLLGMLLAPAAVGIYNIAVSLEQKAYMAVWKLGEVLFPTFSALSRDTPERKAAVLVRSSWLLTVLAVAFLAPLALLAHDFLELWMGAALAQSGTRVLQTVAVAGILGCATNASYFFMLGNENTRLLSLISITTGVVTLGVAAVVIPRWGLDAAGLGGLAAMVAQALVLAVTLRRALGKALPLQSLLVGFYSPVLVGLGILVSVHGFGGVRASSWPLLGLWYAGLAGACVALSALVVGALPRGAVHLADMRLLADQVGLKLRGSLHRI